MIMLSMTTQRKEPIAGLFSLEDISYVKHISLRTFVYKTVWPYFLVCRKSLPT